MIPIRKIVFFLLTLFFFSSLTKNLLDYQNKVSFYEGYLQDYESEKRKNTEFKTQLLKKSDVYEVEKTIRNKLNLLREGEVSIILPKPSITPATSTPTPQPIYLQWKEVFF